ncbi:30S ribosomal protein S16 [bacterium]|nr:MAG: 30S ribosomal protein S16 [bacterium]
MGVRIRLRRAGKTNAPFYQIIVADARAPRDGKFIEKLGYYDPRNENLHIKMDRLQEWVKKGAQLSNPVKVLVKRWQKEKGETSKEEVRNDEGTD